MIKRMHLGKRVTAFMLSLVLVMTSFNLPDNVISVHAAEPGGDSTHVCGDECYVDHLVCEIPEHTHSESCYESVLICENTEEGHEHTDECYENVLVCELAEHAHTDECYERVNECIYANPDDGAGDDISGDDAGGIAIGDDVSGDEAFGDDISGNDAGTDVSGDDVSGDDVSANLPRRFTLRRLGASLPGVVYVSADGDDTDGDGSLDTPYATLTKAYDSINSQGTIALLSDISLSGDTPAIIMDFPSKNITITSAKDDGTLLDNEAGDYEGVYTINRGTNTASLIWMLAGDLTLRQVIMDGGSQPFEIIDCNDPGRSGFLVYVMGEYGDCTCTMDTNTIWQNNNLTGIHLGEAGGACGGAASLSYENGSYDCKLYMKSNARITGNTAPRHGGAVTIYHDYGHMYMSDDALVDNNGVHYKPEFPDRYFGGGAILVYGDVNRGSELYISDNAMITNNYVDMSNTDLPDTTSACAVQTNFNSKIYMSGNARIFDNFCLNTLDVVDNTQANVYDASTDGGSVYVSGALGANAKIGVTAKNESNGTVVAKGSGYSLVDADTSHFFYDRNNFGINRSGNTLVLGSIQSVNITSQQTADCSSVTVKLSQNIDIIKNDVTVFLEGRKLDSSKYSVTTSGDTVTITFAGVPIANGSKVGVQINKNGYTINGGNVKETLMTGHNIAYSLSADKKTITMTCTREACPYHTHPGTVTLSAADAEYAAGTAYSGAELQSNQSPVVVDSDTFVYYLSNGMTKTTSSNSGAAGEGKAPVDAHNYVVKYTLGTVTAEISFAIVDRSNPGVSGVVYVSADGNDTTGAGTLQNPYATLNKAYTKVAPAGTIALLSDISLSGSTSALIISDGKEFTITSAKADGSLLTNAPGDFDGVYTIHRGTNTATVFEMKGGSLSLTNVIVDGGSDSFSMTGGNSSNSNRSGLLVYMLGTQSQCDLILDTNAVLQNNNTLGAHNGNPGGSCGGAIIMSREGYAYSPTTIYMRSNGRITGNIAPRHGGAITMYDNSTLYMTDDAMIDNNGVVNGSNSSNAYFGGGALLIYSGYIAPARVYMSGNSIVANNYVDMLDGYMRSDTSACSVQLNKDSELYMSENARIFDNFCVNTQGVTDNTQANIYDSTYEGGAVFVYGSLGEQAKIGVTAKNESNGTVVAEGSGYSLVDADASHFFYDRNNFGINRSENTLVLGSVQSVNITSQQTADCSSVTVKLSQAIDIIKNDVTLFLEGKKLDSSKYSVSTSGDTVTITFVGISVANGTKVGVQISKNGYTINGGDVKETLMTGHDISYSLSADKTTITMTCTRETCPYHTHPGTVVLSAEDVEYEEGTTYSCAAVQSNQSPVVVDSNALVYYLENGTTKTTASNSGAAGEGKAPVNGQRYVVKLPLGSVTAQKTFEIRAPHVHGNWNYTANGSVITAQCSEDSFRCYLEITADDAVYSGSICTATIMKDLEFPTPPDIVYYESVNGEERLTKKSANGSSGTGKAPTLPGSYVAKVTVEDATASVSFEIAKIDQSILPPSALVQNIKTNEVTLIAAASGHGATSYAVNTVNVAPTSEASWQTGTTFTNLTSGTRYYFFARYAGDAIYNEAVSEGSDITTNSKRYLPGAPGGIEPVPDPEDPDDPVIPKYPFGDDYEVYPGGYHGDPIFPKPTPNGTVIKTYSYEGRESTVYGPTTVKPTAVGKYYFVIRMEDEEDVAIKKLPFEITKKEEGPIIGIDPTPGIPGIPLENCPFPIKPTIIDGVPRFPDNYIPTGTVNTTYTYEGREGTVYGPSSVQPTGIGKYYLVITVEDDLSIGVSRYPFEIKKNRKEEPIGITPTDPPITKVHIPYELDPDIITGEPEFPDDYTPQGDVITTYTYVGRDGTVYPADGVPTTVKPTLAGKYYLIVTLEDDESISSVQIPFEIEKETVGPIRGADPVPGPPDGDPIYPAEPDGPTIPTITYGQTPFELVPKVIDSEPQFPDNCTPVGDVIKTYTYVGRDGTTYGPTTVQPTAVGKYYLEIKIEDDVKRATKRVPFEITKKIIGDDTGIIPVPGPEDGEPEDPEDPTGRKVNEVETPFNPKPQIFTGEPEFPDNYTPSGDVIKTYTYVGRAGTVYPADGRPTATKPTKVGKYYLIITVEDNNSKVVQKIPFKITKKKIGDDTGVTPKEGPDDGDPVDPEDPIGPKIPKVGNPFENVPEIFEGEPAFPDDYTPEGDVITTYTYIGRAGTVYPADGKPTTTKPTKVGKYYLIITVEDNECKVEQKLPFEIEKTDAGEPGGITPKLPTDPSFPSGGDWTPNPTLYTGEPTLTPNEGTVIKNYYYEGRETTVYGPSVEKPVKAGKYYYVITIEDDEKIATKKIPFQITKRDAGDDTGVTPNPGPEGGEPIDPEDPDGPTIPTIPYDPTDSDPIDPNPDIFTGTPGFPTDDPADGEVVTTYAYEGREGTVYGPTSEKPTAIGKYNLIITVEDDSKKIVQKIPFEITKATGTITVTAAEPTVIPSKPDGSEPFSNPIPDIITGNPELEDPKSGTASITYTYEGRDGTLYPNDGIPTEIRPTKTGKYNLIITMEDDINKAVRKIPFEITKLTEKEPIGIVPQPDPEIPYDPETPISPVPGIIELPTEGPTFEDGVGEVTVTYMYEGRDGTVYPENGQPTTVKPVKVGKYNLVVTVSDDVNLCVKRYPFEITKAERQAPAVKSSSNPDGIYAYNEVVKGLANGRVVQLSEDVTYQYSINNGQTWTDVLPGSTEVSDLAVGTVLVREKETAEYKASESVPLTIGSGVYVELDTFNWNTILNTITFGKFFKNTQTVYVKDIKADQSSVESVEYYISAARETSSTLESVSGWKNYTNLGVKLNPTAGYVVYFKVNDVFGNYTYLSTDGIVIDTDAPIVKGIVSGRIYESTTSEISFTVEDQFLDKVTYIKSGEPETELSGTATTVSNQKRYTLTAGEYEKIIAIDKSGNKTEIVNIGVAAGQDKPIMSVPYKPGPGDAVGTPETPTFDGGPYVVYPTDQPTSGTDPILEFDYPDEPEHSVTISTLDPEYEIYLGPKDEDGNPTIGPLTDLPVTISTDATFFVRKKADLPTYGPSEFVPYSIPDAAETMIYLETYPAGAGNVFIDGQSVNHKRIFTGRTIAISETENDEFTFSLWKNKITGATISTEEALSYRAQEKNGTEYLVAVYSLSGSNVITIPTDASAGGVVTKDFTYDGTVKRAIADSDISPYLTLVSGSVTNAIDAGTYTFTLEPQNGYRWEDATTTPKTYVWHISKASTDTPTVVYSLSDGYIHYTGTTGRKVAVKRGKTGTEREYASFANGQGVINQTDDGQPITQSNPLQQGTYYVMTKGDGNHNDSIWVTVIVGQETPEIIPIGPSKSELNPVEVITHTKITTTDGIKSIVARYRRKGTASWTNSTEIIPVSTVADVKYPNTGDVLAEDTEYEYQTILVMEGPSEATTDDYTIEGPVSSFRTRKSGSTGQGTIVAVVKNDNTSGAKEVIVSIERGNIGLSAESLTVASNAQIETSPVTDLSDGVYNIVLRTKDGKFIETQSVTIKDGNLQRVTFVIHSGEIKSVVEVKPGTPDAAVEGLADIITGAEKTAAEAGEMSVEVKLTVEVKDLATAEDHGKLRILSERDGKEIGLYLDINLYKIKSILNPISGVCVGELIENIGLTNDIVLEIAVPYTSSDEDLNVYRFHDDSTEKLVKLPNRPSSNYVDGTFCVENGYVFIYASGFSTYGFSKLPGVTPTGGDGGSADPDSNDYVGPDGKPVKSPKTGDSDTRFPSAVNILEALLESEEEKKRYATQEKRDGLK